MTPLPPRISLAPLTRFSLVLRQLTPRPSLFSHRVPLLVLHAVPFFWPLVIHDVSMLSLLCVFASRRGRLAHAPSQGIVNPYGTNEKTTVVVAKRAPKAPTNSSSSSASAAADASRDGSRSKPSATPQQKTPEQKNRSLRQSASSVSTEVCIAMPSIIRCARDSSARPSSRTWLR